MKFAEEVSGYLNSDWGYLMRIYDVLWFIIKTMIYYPIASLTFLSKLTTIIFLPKYAGVATGEFIRSIVN